MTRQQLLATAEMAKAFETTTQTVLLAIVMAKCDANLCLNEAKRNKNVEITKVYLDIIRIGEIISKV